MVLESLYTNIVGVAALFIISLAVLLKSSDYFTDYSEKLGLALGIPQFIIGVTIVSIGTSLPELTTSMFALFRGQSQFIAGNAVGSNIANILLIIGVTAVFARHLKVEWDLIQIDLPLLLGSAFLISIMMWDGVFNTGEAVLCLVGFFIYLGYVVSLHKKSKKQNKIKTEKISWKIPVVIILSAVGIYFGAKYTIDAIIAATELPFFVSMGIDTSLIALTVVAIGTSLPELIVSIMAVRKKNYEVALGNVLGSNIFNSFVVLGIPGLFGTLLISQTVITIAIPFMVIATLVFVVTTMDKEVSMYEGGMLLLFYALFLAKLLKFF